MLLPGGDDEVFRLSLLQHEPLRAHIVACMTPVAQRIEIAQEHGLVQPGVDPGESPRNLPRHERLAANRRLVVEENPVAGK